MSRTFVAAVVLSLSLAIAASQDAAAQDVKKDFDKKAVTVPPAPATKSPPKSDAGGGAKITANPALPGEVEVNFLNGSTVRMILQSEKLDIATPYGQLAVPANDIRAIEFGLHFPKGAEARIEQAVTNLGDSNFRVRDQAGKTIIELAPYSYPAVYEASRASDLEVARRAKELVKQLEAAHPKKDLKTAPEDRVITPTFTIVGRILTPTIRAQAELFGQVELPVARMRGLRSLHGGAVAVEVTIEAGKYALNGQWLETEFEVDGRSAIVVTAKGLVDTWPQQGGQYIVGPNGLQGRNMGFGAGAIMVPAGRKIAGPLNGQMYGGMLLGKIGATGEVFTIGERYEGSPEAEGKLYLHIGPSPWNTPSTGHYEVKMARK
jgi:hypothetical protein